MTPQDTVSHRKLVNKQVRRGEPSEIPFKCEGISSAASETADGISKAASETRRQLAPIGYWLTGSNKMTIVIPDDYVQVYQRHQKAVERAAKEAAMNLLRLFKKK